MTNNLVASLFSAPCPATPDAVAALLVQFKVRLPLNFLETFCSVNGATATSGNVYDGEPTGCVSVDWFADLTSGDEVRQELSGLKGRLRRGLFPIGASAGGNCICVDAGDGAIWFVDLELNSELGARRLQPNLDTFLSRLKPLTD